MTLNDEPPERIFLQLHGDCEPEYPVTIDESVTWCWEQIFPQDIEYVRSDVSESMARKAREDCAKICEAYSKHNKMHHHHSEAAQEWQQIETAPHDTELLLYCPFRHESNPERIETGKATRGDRGTVKSTYSMHAWATHWMPTPPPPHVHGNNA